MAQRIWIYLINTFYTNTYRSIKKALSLTVDHLAKLQANIADADILVIYNNYLPIHNAFMTAYNQLQSRLGLYHGKTQTFEEMLEELRTTKINEFRGKVFAVFPEGTANATAIFPQGKEPFYTGTYEQRVEAVETLATTLATFTAEPDLVTLSAQVDAYHTTLVGARALQQNDEGSTETLRTNLKNAHKALTDWMYKNLGLLMAKYYTAPEQVANYFDLTLLRSTGDDDGGVVYEEILVPAGGTVAGGDAPADDDEFEVIREGGTGNIVICTGTVSGTPCGGGFVMAPDDTYLGPFSGMGISGGQYVNITNNGPDDVTIRYRIIE